MSVPMSATKVLHTYFNTGDGARSLTDFAKELKALTPDEKHELATAAAAELGVTLAAA